MAVIAFRRRYDRAVILRYHRVIEADGRHIRRSGNIDDQLAGAVGPERVGDADVEHFLWELGIGEALACIQLLQQLGLGDLVGVAAILIELEDAVLAFDDLHRRSRCCS